MAVNSFGRWKFFRELVMQKKSGCMTLQSGPNYISWHMSAGNVSLISSTAGDLHFSAFLLKHKVLKPVDLQRAEMEVGEQRTLGSVLLQKKLMEAGQIQECLKEHALAASEWLFDPSAHLFWSQQNSQQKHYYVPLELPFSHILLSCDRTFFPIGFMIKTVRELPPQLRLSRNWPSELFLSRQEQQVLVYVKSVCTLNDLLNDSELDVMTVYRTVFLLWSSGFLQDAIQRQEVAASQEEMTWWDRMRSVPPDWIFPLTAGCMIGAILTPSPSPPSPEPKTRIRYESLKETTESSDTMDTKIHRRDAENAEKK